MFQSFSTAAMMLWNRLSLIFSVDSAGTAVTTTKPLLLPDGTAAAPSLAFSGATNYGLYRDGLGLPNLVVAGTARVRWSAASSDTNMQVSTGIGIGATTSTADVQVSRRSAGTPVTNLGGSTFSAATNSATLGGVAHVNTTSAATTGTTEQILATYTLPANALSANGKGVRITAWGSTAANANSKTFRVRFGGIGGTGISALATTTASAVFHSTANVIRTGASAQVSIATINSGTSGGAASGIVNHNTAIAADTTATIDIVVTGTTPTAAGDLTFNGLIVEFQN